MASDRLLDSFARVLARAPDAPLVLSPERSATVADVDAMARAIGARLQELDLPPGCLVALAAPNGPGFLAAWLAIRRAQLVPVLHDAATPGEERARIAADLGAAAELTAIAWPAAAEHFSAKRLAPRTDAAASALRLLPVDTAAVKLTSGSTGRPKGIVTPTAALAADNAQLAATMGL